MKPEIKEQWLQALRSGQYQQATKQLRYHNNFCCLGVLCDLHSKETGEKNWRTVTVGHKTHDPDLMYSSMVYINMEGILPDEVIKWSGLRDPDPTINKVPLSKLNDGGMSFDEIAQLIEEHL